MTPPSWSSAELYDAFMGRWSRVLARTVIASLDPPTGLRWLDVGCGTGALSAAVLAAADPEQVIGVDPSEAYVGVARTQLNDRRASFRLGTATDLPVPAASVDRVVSGLVLNFVPNAGAALREMRRVLVPGGTATAYVWDYVDGMQMFRRFWDAAIAEDPAAAALDEGQRSILSQRGGLDAFFADAGFEGLVSRPVEIPTVFRDFDDYWSPFLGGQGPAGGHVVALADDARERLRARLESSLPTQPDGSIALTARAWAVTGVLH